MQAFYLKNSEGSYLSAITSKEHYGREQYGKLCVASEGHGAARLIAFCLNRYPGILFLFSEDGDLPLLLGDRPFASKIFPVGIEGGFSPHTVSLYDLQDHSWISIPPLSTEADLGGLRVSYGLHLCRMVDKKLSWEEMTLEVAEYNNISANLKDYFLYLNEIFDRLPGLQFVKRILESRCANDFKIDIMNMYYPFMGIKDLNQISYEMQNSLDFRKDFVEVFCDDYWVKNALNPLLDWQENRQGRQVIECNQVFDVLQKHFIKHEFSSFTHAVNCAYRRIIEPRKRTCVVTTVRNEGTSILEWLAWHRKLGFEHFFVFSNNNDDGSDALLQSLAEANVITWIKNEMGNDVRPQAKVCNYTFSSLPEILDYEWALLLDVDEFLSINRDSFKNIHDLLKWIERNEVDAVGFNWQYTCSSNLMDYKKDFVTKRIQYFINEEVIGLANNLIKSMSKPRYMISSGAHYAVWSSKYHATYRLIQGDIHRFAHNSGNYSDDPMWADHNHRGIANVIHYHFKSAKEFLLRLYRGDVLDAYSDSPVDIGLFKEHTIDTFNQQHMKYGAKILDNYLFKEYELQEIVDQLLSLPNVDQAYQQILRITDERVTNMLNFMLKNQEQLGHNAKQLLKFIQD
ncbi:glycosyltransferase family 2 protein [Commensalibacter nepenthis]|uniref:Glycosyltransferase family 2 protein n=1 Tax=Commensalibacter nepenthis TaxID=3043872 RepID=A0ABT6Q6L8_9PROT|nr:glycosyltransferase family 2 protein [Commensalibacter sp. TBRC 10068]MDI2112535.1 glycosyltransferase family 2 protein [Commensalibacter sp. TBRC 10068]